MKKFLSALLVSGALMASADDSYLYWMIGDTKPYTADNYAQVRVKAIKEGSGDISYLNLYGPSGDDLSTTTVASGDINSLKSDGQALYAKLISGTSYSSFVIELLNDSNKLVAQSATLSYTDALANYYITTANSMTLPAMWAATSFAIPEPNSGLLMLVGMAVLGLRRRKLKKA